MAKYKKTTAVITKLDEYGQTCAANGMECVPVSYEYVVDSITYRGYGDIAPLHTSKLKPRLLTDVYEGRKIKIVYNVEKPTESKTVFEKNRFNPTLPIIIVIIVLVLCYKLC